MRLEIAPAHAFLAFLPGQRARAHPIQCFCFASDRRQTSGRHQRSAANSGRSPRADQTSDKPELVIRPAMPMGQTQGGQRNHHVLAATMSSAECVQRRTIAVFAARATQLLKWLLRTPLLQHGPRSDACKEAFALVRPPARTDDGGRWRASIDWPASSLNFGLRGIHAQGIGVVAGARKEARGSASALVGRRRSGL